jgi:hypothetical protein
MDLTFLLRLTKNFNKSISEFLVNPEKLKNFPIKIFSRYFSDKNSLRKSCSKDYAFYLKCVKKVCSMTHN